MKLPTNLNLVLRVWMIGVVPPFSPYAFMTWTGTTLLFLPFTTRTKTMPATSRPAVSSLHIPSQTEMIGRMVSMSLRIWVARFNLNPETIKHKSLCDFSQSLEPNAKITALCTLQLCLNISFQIQHSSAILKIDAISSETLRAQTP